VQRHERKPVLREILRPRTGALTVSTLVAVFGWFQTDVVGVNRVFTVFVTFGLVYLVFNATAAAVEWIGG
jgi:cation transporter-like permease